MWFQTIYYWNCRESNPSSPMWLLLLTGVQSLGVLDFRMVTHDETGQFTHPPTSRGRKPKFWPIFKENGRFTHPLLEKYPNFLEIDIPFLEKYPYFSEMHPPTCRGIFHFYPPMRRSCVNANYIEYPPSGVMIQFFRIMHQINNYFVSPF